PLWRLYELARYNRHRFLHPAVVALSGMILDPAAISNAILGRNGPWTLQVHEGFVEGRTEVARFPVQPIDPSEEVYVDAGPALEITFTKGTPVVSGEPMTKILSEVYNHIAAVVVPSLAPYLTQMDIVRVNQPYSLLPTSEG
ncbi:MAG TPA: hypothetical protein VNA27_14430, partial [Rubrobacteraceae bacterium]|nr:hypothetical protein [Rubrobacteraceae bacterium]